MHIISILINILIISLVVGFFGWVFYKIKREVDEENQSQENKRSLDEVYLMMEKSREEQAIKELEGRKKQKQIEDEERARQLKEERDRQRERSKQEEKDRKNKLVKKYGLEMGTDIWLGGIWIGMSEEQLIESKDIADDKSEGSHRIIYKYGENKGPRGGITYDLEVTVKDGVVKSWQEK